MAADCLQMLVDLGSQLAGRGYHQSTNASVAVATDDALQDWENERSGLAASGHRRREEILPRERWRHRRLLNWGWLGKAHVDDAAHERGVDLEITELQARSCTFCWPRLYARLCDHNPAWIRTVDLPEGCRPGRWDPISSRPVAHPGDPHPARPLRHLLTCSEKKQGPCEKFLTRPRWSWPLAADGSHFPPGQFHSQKRRRRSPLPVLAPDPTPTAGSRPSGPRRMPRGVEDVGVSHRLLRRHLQLTPEDRHHLATQPGS